MLGENSPYKDHFYFVHLYDDFSGSPRVLSEMVKVIDGNKTLITSNTDGILSRLSGVNIFKFNYKIETSKIKKILFFFFANFNIFIILFRQLLKNRKKDKRQIVIVNTMLPFGALLVARLFTTNTILYLHETSIKPALLKNFLRFCISKCAKNIIYVSNYLNKKENFYRIKSKIVIYNPISPILINKEIDFEYKFNERNIIFLSSLVPYKGINDYIKIAHLSYNEGSNITFNLVLNCTAEQFNLFKVNTCLPSNVCIYNRPNNLKEIYYKSSFVLNLSNPELWVETFGLTLAEGMANGLIPIGPKVGGPAEVINDKCGFHFSHYEHDLILQKINYLLANKHEYLCYAENALKCSKEYTIDTYANSLNDFLKNIK
ncbi:glycosyltransferase family 4 protein [Leminorella grimontii]|uniref:glycosyltransferase family 4 protein n=1 Tax=Leminorella grimontii TaxID=82981 RepID=UPI00321FAE14